MRLPLNIMSHKCQTRLCLVNINLYFIPVTFETDEFNKVPGSKMSRQMSSKSATAFATWCGSADSSTVAAKGVTFDLVTRHLNRWPTPVISDKVVQVI
jgi:hypothetical protein